MASRSDAAAICDLNDAFRRSFAGGRVVVTASIADLPEQEREAILAKVRSFEAFTSDNDPHGEHDFGTIEHLGCDFFWKIDYYTPELTAGSECPADPAQTTRVLTIMRADEY